MTTENRVTKHDLVAKQREALFYDIYGVRKINEVLELFTLQK